MNKLDELIQKLEDIKIDNNNQKQLFVDELKKVDLYESKSFFVVSEMTLNSERLRKNYMKHWNKEDSLAAIYHYSDEANASIIHRNIMMFYEEDEVKTLTESDFDDSKYVILGIQKPSKHMQDIFDNIEIETWGMASNYDEYKEIVSKCKENLHIFKVDRNKIDELLDKFQKATTLYVYLREKNCFDMTENADNSGRYKVHMKGDIIITDPCYLINNRDESDRPKWDEFHPYRSLYEYPDYDKETHTSAMFFENSEKMNKADKEWCEAHPDDRDSWDEYDLSPFGFTSYLCHSTLYGDWSCHTFDKDTGKSIGEFCADGGEVGVFLLDEVLKYNPQYNDYENAKFTVTLIKDFDGEVWFEKIDDETLVVRGEGNINFYTRQTGL